MSEAYEGRQIVGIDLHRRRSVLVWMTEDGRTLETTRISNDVDYLRQVMARVGEAPEVVLEGHLRLVLGRGRAERAGCHGASGPSAGGEGVRVPPGQERRAGCRRTTSHVAPRTA